MKVLNGHLSRHFNRIRKVRYFALELLLCRLSTQRKISILFSNEEGAKHLIRKGFRYTRHVVEFGDFTPESIARYDLLVPLTIQDIDRLNGMRDLIHQNPIPIPTDACVRLCDDKALLNEFLIGNGFGEVIPKTEGDCKIPYILKKRVDDTGKNSHFVIDEDQERDLLSSLPINDYYRQEIIPGRFEYASHVLYFDRRIIRSLNFEYEMKGELLVKGKEWPIEQRIIPCPFPDLFASILQAIGFEGLCCIDYKIRNRRPYIMEINPRFGGSLRLYFFSFIRHLRRVNALTP